MLFQGELSPYPIFTLPGWTLGIGYALILIAMIIIGAAFKNYDTSEFLGVKPMNEFNPLTTPLIKTGLNAYTRHPIYFGIIVGLAGYLIIAFDYKTLAFFSISVAYIIVGAMLEERKLIVLYGDSYIQYKERVKMLIPFIL
jgi:protein-S-isoprenylcysteine O-methyltransferase Ste14